MDVVRIPLSDTMRFGGRDVDAATVRLLAESMAAVGLLSPIMVKKGQRQEGPSSKETFWIIAGRHRVQAATSLGWSEIDAILVDLEAPQAELCEIDENLIRSDLSDAQRAKAHARREELLVAMGLIKSKPGPIAADSAAISYSKKTAADLGVSERAIRQDLARGKKIAPEVIAKVTGTALDKGVVLDELAKTPMDQQMVKLGEIERREQNEKDIKRSAQMANRAVDKNIALASAADFANWLMARTDLNELAVIISWLEGTKAKDVIAALRREAA